MEMYSFVSCNITTVSYTTNPFMKSGPYYMLLFWQAAGGPETALCPVVVFCFVRLLHCGSWMSCSSLAPMTSGLPINMFLLSTFPHSGQRTWAIVSPLPCGRMLWWVPHLGACHRVTACALQDSDVPLYSLPPWAAGISGTWCHCPGSLPRYALRSDH